MITERLPGLCDLSTDEKWELLLELEDELWTDDSDEKRSAEILALLEERRAHFKAHPETAMTVEEARRRMFASRP
jgi:hypothetical protein